MSNAQAGHGATIAMEQDPTGSPGVFTVVAELNGDITFPGLMRGETEHTPHQDTIDSWNLGVLRRDPLQFSVNFIYDNATHDHATGLIKAMIDNETRGFRIRGPGGTANTDEWILSGAVQQFTETAPVREGTRSAEVSIRMSGPMIIDGTTVGTVG